MKPFGVFEHRLHLQGIRRAALPAMESNDTAKEDDWELSKPQSVDPMRRVDHTRADIAQRKFCKCQNRLTALFPVLCCVANVKLGSG